MIFLTNELCILLKPGKCLQQITINAQNEVKFFNDIGEYLAKNPNVNQNDNPDEWRDIELLKSKNGFAGRIDGWQEDDKVVDINYGLKDKNSFFAVITILRDGKRVLFGQTFAKNSVAQFMRQEVELGAFYLILN